MEGEIKNSNKCFFAVNVSIIYELNMYMYIYIYVYILYCFLFVFIVSNALLARLD